jgi:hypothetical protein
MNPAKATGWLLNIGAIGVLIPFIILSVNFEYPDILRKETSEVLTRFNGCGSELVLTWFFCLEFGWFNRNYALVNMVD